jgi:hypothetical protein
MIRWPASNMRSGLVRIQALVAGAVLEYLVR